MKDLKKEMGERIKGIRLNKKMSLEALGAILNVGKSSVFGYEAGDNYPSPESIIKIANIGGKTTDWLLTGKDQHIAYPTEPIGNHTVNESARVDLSLVKLIIESVEEHLQSNHLTMTPAKIAELVEVLYEEISESSDNQVNKGTVARLIRLAT